MLPQGVMTPLDEPEELGSVYESLLELHPELDADAGTFIEASGRPVGFVTS